MDKSWSKDIKYEIECVSKREGKREGDSRMHMYDIFIDMLLPLYLFCNLDKKGCLTSFQYHNIPNLD